ncbi:DUF4352 domain-containing protein [Clostridium algidicarnis]|uniref:DUF4352 domain-containing protein n=1 Tax=Clostridium algidicarnis TaxID=37659 RepID=UPI001C0CA24F|nr:DUF4352 domain-containing protein [Clostridium algidicarnis]MBU3195643.1 DUF4352 domain-containing protein [Clostridium algidicarnis]
MKKSKIITIGLVIAAFIVGYFVGDSSAINRVNKVTDSKVTSKQADGTKVEKQEEKKPEQKTYKIGEEGTSGNWNIKVLEVKEANTVQGGSSSDNRTTNEKFIIVKLEMKNTSKQPIQYSSREFMLGNIKDKSQYTINDTAFNAMGSANSNETIYKKNSDFVGVYTDVNPNTTKQTYIVFEVPKDMNISDSVLISANGNAEATGFHLE